MKMCPRSYFKEPQKLLFLMKTYKNDPEPKKKSATMPGLVPIFDFHPN